MLTFENFGEAGGCEVHLFLDPARGCTLVVLDADTGTLARHTDLPERVRRWDGRRYPDQRSARRAAARVLQIAGSM